jgi:hypothetical protein
MDAGESRRFHRLSMGLDRMRSRRECCSHRLSMRETVAIKSSAQRFSLDGYVNAEWGTSDNNRRARYYTLTTAGRKRLAMEREEFERVVGAIQAVLTFA